MNWKKIAIPSLTINILLIIFIIFSFIFGVTTSSDDTRVKIDLSETEKAFLLQEMRLLLESLNGIHRGIAAQDRDLAASEAEKAGMKMVLELSASEKTLMLKLPLAMKKLGIETHKQFDKIAEELRKGENWEKINFSIFELTERCVACHSSYRIH